MPIRPLIVISAAALSLFCSAGNASADGTIGRASSSGTRAATTLRVQAVPTAAKPGGTTCHTPGCIEAFWDACGEAGGFTFEDPILNENGAETGAAELDCL